MENCVNKFLKALGEDTNLERDAFSEYIAFHGLGDTYSKRWLANIVPADVLRLSLKEAVNIIVKAGIFIINFLTVFTLRITGTTGGGLLII